jgi:hypothetical protein
VSSGSGSSDLLQLWQLLALDPPAEAERLPAPDATVAGAEFPAAISGRWMLLAEAGCGKSTSLQQVAVDLADWRRRLQNGESLDPQQRDLLVENEPPLALYISLPELARQQFLSPIVTVAQAAAAEQPSQTASLVEFYRQQAQQPGRLWLLLDGFDELNAEQRQRLRRELGKWLEPSELGHCRWVISSRATGYESIGHGFQPVSLEPLRNPSDRLQLLRAWLPAQAESIANHIEGQPGLVKLAETPFLLSLIAKLEEDRRLEAPHDQQPQPHSRDQLYDQAIDWFLRRGWALCQPGSSTVEVASGNPAPAGIQEPQIARELLGDLALKLMEDEALEYAEAAVTKAIEACFPKESEGWKRIDYHWKSPSAFRQDIGRHSGFFGPLRGPGRPWRWLHRSLGEFLAGEALARRGVAECLARMQSADNPRWAETYGHAIGRLRHFAAATPKSGVKVLAHDPREELLDALAERSPALLLRLLPEVEQLDPARGLELLLKPRDTRNIQERWDEPTPAREWDGDLLLALVQRWKADGQALADLAGLLLNASRPDSPLRKASARPFTHLGGLLYAAQLSQLPVTVVDFARDAQLPALDLQRERAAALRVPHHGALVVFPMGSSETHSVAQDDERPFRPGVRLTPFLLSKTAVTEAQFRRLTGQPPPKGQENHPVTKVTWWEAWLYCQWVGGYLPSEAQWECAARAATLSQWPGGDTEEGLEQQAWFRGGKGKSNVQVHPVGQLQPNPWGFHDLLGNVWEWCQDWYGPYDQSDTIDPVGPPRGARRVLRGGSAWNDADYCRPGRRGGDWPWLRDEFIGFRVAFPLLMTSS